MTAPTGSGAPLFRRPAAATTRADLDERDRFAQLTAASPEAARAAAQTWRNGLASFVTLVTTGVIIKGQDVATGLTTAGRITVTVLIGLGLALAVVGLWLALAAEAGFDARTRTLADIRQEFDSLTAFELNLARHRARMLSAARLVVAASVACLLAGVASTWWAPAAVSSPPAFVKVTTGATVVCGELDSADGGAVRLTVDGQHEPAVIPLNQITNLGVAASCP